MALEPFMIPALIGMTAPCSSDLVSPEGDELEVVNVVFDRESSKFSLRIPI